MAAPNAQLEAVATYYGETLKSTFDLKTSACCPMGTAPPPEHLAIMKKLHPEVTSRFYGCGSPIPPLVKGKTVLDLGCGTGRDVYLLSGLVGPEGQVIGVDMTPKQLEVARKHQAYHAEALLGGGKSNVDLREGYIENLAGAGIEESSVDVVVSNCVCNLSPDKKAVFSEVARALKPGGEFYFSDIYTDRRVPEEAQKDEELVGECLGGALYLNDFVRSLREVGLSDPRVISAFPVQVDDKRLKSLVPDVKFYSLTVRIFKMGEGALENELEDFGQKATYIGGESEFELDSLFAFRKDVPLAVDGDTAEILRRSRYSKLFRVDEKGPHKGSFRSEGTAPLVRYMVDQALDSNMTKEKTKQISSANGCCGPTPGANGESKAENTKGCCKPSNTDSCCAPATKTATAATSKGGCCGSGARGGCC